MAVISELAESVADRAEPDRLAAVLQHSGQDVVGAHRVLGGTEGGQDTALQAAGLPATAGWSSDRLLLLFLFGL
ncbi:MULTISPECIES: hypothetical protein [Streptosporangium]|uniref:Uncharacterized protein n=1 Tax=Streptosporangium brasiliense TaxID=47480 RepID=A0ABT9RBI2_9ACTN|nr:hypothetical protein [Streptosporangium brasiliense]MDP9866628.1 hypothetical protein [Streptosporangium brasiliense]